MILLFLWWVLLVFLLFVSMSFLWVLLFERWILLGSELFLLTRAENKWQRPSRLRASSTPRRYGAAKPGVMFASTSICRGQRTNGSVPSDPEQQVPLTEMLPQNPAHEQQQQRGVASPPPLRALREAKEEARAVVDEM